MVEYFAHTHRQDLRARMSIELGCKYNQILGFFELQKMNLEWEFNQWKGNLEQIDDVCIMAIKCF